ncbi:DNA translocase FtsK [Acuticoccus sp. I52.16.1]|uniref:DNA translocase FtsK n=1 Tax=Acuticoccus sp. I52.16.1 TaxID=2928472 RepID=UPI001FD0BC22|nr:DNA translocase FtsK [Acuticoccus sp. I52.16.1]UOM33574.1 DNA translocase FtsK 4TM domain-containing protein [Acuticoccus sp. I52.16.1]
MSVMRLRALEQILDDPSVLFARRAMATVSGLAFLALSVILSIALATWTVSDPSFTHATDAPVVNAMGSFGAAFADPVMQLFGVAAPLLILPLPLWGLRLVSGRPVGWTPGRLGAGLAALFLAPGFVNVFPVTESWPLPLGLGGVVGSVHHFVWADICGIGSGAVLGFIGGVTGLLAAVALVSAITPVRRRERPADLGFTIRRSRMEPDEYGLDDTDAYESDASSRLAELYGAMAHSVMMLRARLMGPKARRRKPSAKRAPAPTNALRAALEGAPEAEADQDVYRPRRAERPRRENARQVPPAPGFVEGELPFDLDDEPEAPAPRQRAEPAPVRQPRPSRRAAEAAQRAERGRRPASAERTAEPGRRADAAAAAAAAAAGAMAFARPLRGPAARLQQLPAAPGTAPAPATATAAVPPREAAARERAALDEKIVADDGAWDEDAAQPPLGFEAGPEDAPLAEVEEAELAADYEDIAGVDGIADAALEDDDAGYEDDDAAGYEDDYDDGEDEPAAPAPATAYAEADEFDDEFGEDDYDEEDAAEEHDVPAATAAAPAARRDEPRYAAPDGYDDAEAGWEDDADYDDEAEDGDSEDGAMYDASGSRVIPAAGAMKPGRRIVREAQPSFLTPSEYEFPPLALLTSAPADRGDRELTEDALEANARVLEGVLADFGVKGAIINVRPGPVVTLYELEPAPGIKSSRVIGLADDIARSMSAVSARVAVIPGKNAIGIELPNSRRVTVYLRELLASEDFERTKQKLPMCLGKTIGGEAVIADLARMPHLLVAGTTGSGKSVSINTMILSLLYHHKPEHCRIILIDPKMLELSVYDGIPHLLTPVVTDPKKAVSALRWAVREMEDRYRKMAKLGVRNIDGYNQRLKESQRQGEPLSRLVQTGFDKRTGEAIFEEEVLDLDPMPFIVVIVDEMADLMLVAGKEIEGAIQRLAQMARAAGIHLIMATQRPSVDVITGTIKANFPTRISFAVTSKIDSRTILGEMGAEQLLGMGDMLYMASGGRIQRVHGPFVSDEEVEDVVAHLRSQGAPEYLHSVLEDDEEEEEGAGGGAASGLDAMSESDDLYDRAVALVLRDRKASTSYIQRRLSIGYNRAATLIERMEKEGVVSPANNAGKRDILVPAEGEAA